MLITAGSTVNYLSFMETRSLPYNEKLYQDMLVEYKTGNYEQAYTLGRNIISKIKNLNDEKKKALYKQVRTVFDSDIAPAYYVMKRFWSEGNKLYRWDEEAKRVMFIAKFDKRIDDFKISPDKKRVAVLGNHYCWIVNTDGSNLVELNYGANVINGWVDNNTIEFEGYNSSSSFKGKKNWPDGVLKINENNGPISFEKQ